MKIEDTFSISVDEYHVRINVKITPSISPPHEARPRWKRQYDELGKGGMAVMETVRQELEALDEEDYIPVGTAGFSVGDLFLEHDHDEGLRVKNDDEEVLGELSAAQFRELIEHD